MLNEGNQIHNFISSSGSGTVINYGSGSDFITSYGSSSGSGSTNQKVTVPTVPVPVHNAGAKKLGKKSPAEPEASGLKARGLETFLFPTRIGLRSLQV